MINIDAENHVTGKSLYVDDLREYSGTLYALPFSLPATHALIHKIDITEAAVAEGIACVLTHEDIPGDNQIGIAVADEPLFAENEVHYSGQPAGIIIGESDAACRHAARQLKFEFDELPPVTSPRAAFEKGFLIIPPRIFRIGSTYDHWGKCTHIAQGRVELNGQEHVYLETQGASAILKEGGSIFVASSTQSPTAVQYAVSRVLDIPMHKIEVDTLRIGGGFGGKEDQATPWAVMAALGAKHTGRPVKVILHRQDDMRMTGKRNPYSADFRIGLSDDLRIICYEVTFYQNAGAAADLSPAILERTLFHCTNAYYIPNVTATAYCCRTNLPPNTAFRGFGGPQGKFVIESAIVKAAEIAGVEPFMIQKANLVKDGDEFPYGQIMTDCKASDTWEEADKLYGINGICSEVNSFNIRNTRYKKGFAVQPICFGISFTNTMMNHARTLVHIYKDGSIVVNTGAVEMGQGVNTKLVQVVCSEFGVSPARVKIESANTLRIANTSPTAASSGADLNGKALEFACTKLRERIISAAQKLLGYENAVLRDERVTDPISGKSVTWDEIVMKAFQDRISLSEHAHYATPVIHFDKSKEKGHPFAYHVYGTAVAEVTVDCIRGTYVVDSVKLVHDSGKCMNRDVDNGQIEGGLVQGIGWMTMEEVMYDKGGRLLSNALSNYKIPDIYSAPRTIEVNHFETAGSDFAIHKSKAVGEPPLMYAIGVYFAIRNAVRAFNPKADLKIDSPYTPEKVLLDLYRGREY